MKLLSNYCNQQTMLCIICQESITQDDNVYITSCAHKFHTECWNDYVRHQSHQSHQQSQQLCCPLCKTNQEGVVITVEQVSTPYVSEEIVDVESITDDVPVHHRTCCCQSKAIFTISFLLGVIIIILITLLVVQLL